MNKAFTKDDDQGEAPFVPPRAPLPEGVPNYVTPRGLELLRREQQELEAERAALAAVADERERRRASEFLARRGAELADRIASAVVVPPPPAGTETVRFGASVRVRASDGTERTCIIVGVDEADGAQGRIAFVSPLARALLGRSVGEAATVRTPRGDEELEVLAVAYSDGETIA